MVYFTIEKLRVTLDSEPFWLTSRGESNTRVQVEVTLDNKCFDA